MSMFLPLAGTITVLACLFAMTCAADAPTSFDADRERMVARQIESRGVSDPRVLQAARQIMDRMLAGVILLAGVTLDLIQFPAQAGPGSVASDKIFKLGLAVGPGLMLLYLLTLVFVSRYRLTRERHAEILAELARRSGA